MKKSVQKLKPILFTLSSLAVALSATNANAHGYMVSPQDYAYSCSVGSTSGSELCSSTVIQQKNEINQGDAAGNHKAFLMDGQICSASKGGEYGVLDVPSSLRHATSLVRDKDGKIEIQYMPTAAHKTWYWDYFVTRDGFNPDTDKLTWADLERIDVIDAKGAAPGKNNQMHSQKVSWPADKTGKRILFQVWQRPNPGHTPHDVLGSPPSNIWDSGEAFYSCANVIVDTGEGGNGGTEPPAIENPWQSSERFASAPTAIDVGYTVVARIMNKGSEQFKIPLDITADNVSGDKWKMELAEKINSDASISKFAKVGVIDTDYEVTLHPDANQNYIYFTGKEWSHLIESNNNVKPEIKFSISWPNYQPTYEFAANQPLSVPFSLNVTEEMRLAGNYSYTAVVKQVGAENQEPVDVLQGPVSDNGVSSHINVKNAGTYSVNVRVKNEKGITETQMYHFDVIINDQQPETGDFDYVFPNGLESYVAGTKVKATDGNIYQCKSGPVAGFCKQWKPSANAFEPSVGFAWKDAWDLVK